MLILIQSQHTSNSQIFFSEYAQNTLRIQTENNVNWSLNKRYSISLLQLLVCSMNLKCIKEKRVFCWCVCNISHCFRSHICQFLALFTSVNFSSLKPTEITVNRNRNLQTHTRTQPIVSWTIVDRIIGFADSLCTPNKETWIIYFTFWMRDGKLFDKMRC